MSAIDPDRRITAVQCSKSDALMSELGQSLQIDTPAPPAQCLLYPR